MTNASGTQPLRQHRWYHSHKTLFPNCRIVTLCKPVPPAPTASATLCAAFSWDTLMSWLQACALQRHIYHQTTEPKTCCFYRHADSKAPGACESSLTPVAIGAFSRMRALSSRAYSIPKVQTLFWCEYKYNGLDRQWTGRKSSIRHDA